MISYGILCLKPSHKLAKDLHNILSSINKININNAICPNMYIQKFNNLKSDLKFTLISKKHSYSFMSLINGKYPINENYIKSLLTNLSISELELFKTQTIEYILDKYKNNIINKNVNEIISKFNIVKNLLDQSNSIYLNPEWEIPKGKMIYNESMLQCAIREFTEETGIQKKHITVYDNIEPLVEIFRGTDNKYYMYIYYIATINPSYVLSKTSTLEASDIKFLTLDECIDNIRENNNKRKKLLYSVYLQLIKLL